MDILPGASLEFRVYIILGIVGIMFFAAILALGVGRLFAIRSSSNINNIAESPNSPFRSNYDQDVKQDKKKNKPKKERSQKDKIKTVSEIFEEEPEEIFEPSVEKKSFFGKKKRDAVEMLAKPSGYVEEYAPSHTRNMEDNIIPEYDSNDYLTSLDGSARDEKKQDSWEDDFLSEEEDKPIFKDSKKNRKDSTSPFGGNDDWDL